MTDTARLVIAVDSSGAKRATDNLDKLDRAAGNSERAASKWGKAWGTAIGLLSSAVIIGATTAFIRQADAMANLSAKLKLVTGDTKSAAAAQKDLFDLAQRTSSDLESTIELYVKLGQSSKELAGDHAVLLDITEKVSKALVISGADAASSAAVIRQFSQAMAAGSLRGDEFISVMEGAPRLARAIADGMGVAVGSLRKMAAEGKLTSDAIIKALEDQGEVLDREFGEMPLTVSRATQQVRNALMEMIGDTDKTSGATQGLAEKIGELARLLESEEVKTGFASIITGLVGVAGAAAEAASQFANFAHWVGEAAARSRGFVASDDALGTQERLADLRREQERRKNAPAGTGVLASMFGTSWSAVAMGDKSDTEIAAEIAKLEQYVRMQEEAASVAAKAARAAAQQATDAMWASATVVNADPSLWGQGTATGGAQRRTQAQHDLNAAVAETLTLEQEWAILEAEVYGPAAIEAHNKRVTKWAEEGQAIEQATDKMTLFADQAARNMQDAFADFLFDPFENGVKGMVDSFANAIRQMLAQAAAAKIFDLLGQWASGYTGAGASWINALGKAAMGGGRASGGPVMAGQSYWVGDGSRPELFTPSTNGAISQGGGVTVKPQINLHIEGAPSQPQVQSKQNGSGGFDISVLFKQTEQWIAGNVANGSSPLNPALRQRYALRDAI